MASRSFPAFLSASACWSRRALKSSHVVASGRAVWRARASAIATLSVISPSSSEKSCFPSRVKYTLRPSARTIAFWRAASRERRASSSCFSARSYARSAALRASAISLESCSTVRRYCSEQPGLQREGRLVVILAIADRSSRSFWRRAWSSSRCLRIFRSRAGPGIEASISASSPVSSSDRSEASGFMPVRRQMLRSFRTMGSTPDAAVSHENLGRKP